MVSGLASVEGPKHNLGKDFSGKPLKFSARFYQTTSKGSNPSIDVNTKVASWESGWGANVILGKDCCGKYPSHCACRPEVGPDRHESLVLRSPDSGGDNYGLLDTRAKSNSLRTGASAYRSLLRERPPDFTRERRPTNRMSFGIPPVGHERETQLRPPMSKSLQIGFR